jgi:hypothetical protein
MHNKTQNSFAHTNANSHTPQEDPMRWTYFEMNVKAAWVQILIVQILEL